MKPTFALSLLAGLLFVTSAQSHAQVRVPKLFSSHMVLQRDMPIHVWGEAAPGERVTVSLQDASTSATADKTGRWSAYLAPRSAGGPYVLIVRASNVIQFDDIFIGDIWLASGQSNMELPLKGYDPNTQIKDSAKEIANANYPQMRLLLVQHDASDFPLIDPNTSGWSVCNPASAANFSAVAYFFGRALQQKERVPIGIIDVSWGGSPAEAWTSLDTLGQDASLLPVFASRAARMNGESIRQHLDFAAAEAASQGRPIPVSTESHAAQISWQPAALYNAMIAPFTRLPIRGVIWYQGESNSSPRTAPLYSRLFPALIQDWRTHWHQADLPFLFVQLSAYGGSPVDEWGIVRQAQLDTLHLANTGMAVTIDIGNEHNVHPADKQDVGERLALLARSTAYKETLVSSGPLFKYAYAQGSTMHVIFANATGLTSKKPLESFEVAGTDGVFIPASAKIESDTIAVYSPSVPEPQYVRYGWANYPPADHSPNLYNAAGLPAAPFTSYPLP